MERYQGKYALIQFCPVPERQEYLNIGLLLIVPEIRFCGIRLSRGQARVDRVFGKQPKSYLEAIKESFRSRLLAELKRAPDGASLPEFARKRANDIRLSPLHPVMVLEPEADLDRLFEELVGDEERAPNEPRIRQKLREAFVANKVEQFLDKPDDIELPEYGMTVNVPYGYQNGVYNLIDGMRLPAGIANGLREAGKREIEGGLIWKHFQNAPVKKRLIVVGDFAQQSDGFYNAVAERFAESRIKLYRLDDMRPLFADILENAQVHGKMHGAGAEDMS